MINLLVLLASRNVDILCASDKYCYHKVPSAIWKISKYQKRGKYLPILQAATCGNYFIVKCLLKSNMALT